MALHVPKDLWVASQPAASSQVPKTIEKNQKKQKKQRSPSKTIAKPSRKNKKIKKNKDFCHYGDMIGHMANPATMANHIP
jgi:hypothetical protein